MRRIAIILALASALPAPAAAADFPWPIQVGSPNSLGAGWRQQQDEARRAVQSGRHVPLGRVLEQLRRRTPGKQLDVGLEQRDGRQVYRVRWAAADGRRIDYIVDAESGAVLRADGE
jgi:uncharacterized membrane protein YkoI